MASVYPTPEEPRPGETPAAEPEMPSPEELLSTPAPEREVHMPPPPVYTAPAAAPSEPLSPEDERTWAMVAHLSVLANLVTGFLGPVIALIIYLAYKDRSRYVAYQSMQSFVFQLVWWVGGGILTALAWTISGVLSVILIGCLLMPLALLVSFIPLAALVYGVIAAVETNQGKDFRYWLIGDWVRGTLTGV